MNGEPVKGRYQRALNKLTKWRTVFTGWQLGTRSIEDPESQALRDHLNTTMALRVEVNAMTQLLIRKGVFTEVEFMEQVIVECDHLERAYEQKFPGAHATDQGMSYGPEAMAWMSKFPK